MFGAEFVDHYAATREWEDKTAAENAWFKRALESKRQFEARWNGAKAYRSELK